MALGARGGRNVEKNTTFRVKDEERQGKREPRRQMGVEYMMNMRDGVTAKLPTV